mmetsp:Transcript_5946/g.18298  ORF Transcript_5946/g.18298 Transcript_5946/m.18298 type:complete len:291 (+) Transcript_5946:367-1239(+)
MRPSRADTSELACVKRKMLSTNSSTSWPSMSRKYSATVRPVSATRARAPGGSFIWPYTSVTLDCSRSSPTLMTPEVIISWYRSLPSRVRSPTPANTENPPCALATLLISSMISTVLPTPAPPNRPILPPRWYGASRSTTLMPVTRISWSVDCSTKGGASRWMDHRSEYLTGPCSSTGSPMTLRMRPRVPRPTGTLMGDPVFMTFWPRVRPSVESMAIVRTVLSPTCCETSKTRRMLWSATSRADRMEGSSPSKRTSTTGPMTWLTKPFEGAASEANALTQAAAPGALLDC